MSENKIINSLEKTPNKTENATTAESCAKATTTRICPGIFKACPDKAAIVLIPIRETQGHAVNFLPIKGSQRRLERVHNMLTAIFGPKLKYMTC